MKRIKIISTLVFLFFCYQLSTAQDSLFKVDMTKHVSHFNITEGQFSTEVKKLLLKEAEASQYIVLGEYHGSPRISEFTASLIPILNGVNYKTLALEIGPESVKIIDSLSQNPLKTTEQLYTFNSTYKYIDPDKDVYTPIPFFESEEDAEFIAKAKSNQWNLIGLDQEFCYGYIPLIDKMYLNLETKDQQMLKELYLNAKDSILHFYKQDDAGIGRLAPAIKECKTVQSFIKKSTTANNKNESISKAIKTTTEIYYYNATRQYYACNSTRIDYMKSNLRKGFNEINFDISKDKMLLKMGAVHTARGFSWLSLFEIGNTLSELADYHGTQSTHLYFFGRYHEEDGKIIDGLDDPEGYSYRFRDLLQFGKKEEWTIIDLRPIREATFYWRKYKLNESVLSIIKHHDFIVIPKLDTMGTPNYK